MPVEVASAALGIFTLDFSGCGQPLVFNIDEEGRRTLNSPANPARPGQLVAIYATWLGLAPAGPPDGIPSGEFAHLSLGTEIFEFGRNPIDTLNTPVWVEAEPLAVSARKAPGLVGVDEVIARLPSPAEDGCFVPLRLRSPIRDSWSS